jgi:hypothetical protein
MFHRASANRFLALDAEAIAEAVTNAARPIQLRKSLPAVIEDAEQNLSPPLRWLLDCMW